MVVLFTCKCEEDPIKTGWARVLTRLYIDFTGVQGQVTPPSTVEFSQLHSNSSKLLWFSSLPARMKENQ